MKKSTDFFVLCWLTLLQLPNEKTHGYTQT